MRGVLQQAIDKYGAQMQLVIAMEEMAELQKELSKAIRGNADADYITEELADVEIMLEQIKMIFGCWFAVEDWKKKKVERLAERLEGSD